MSAPAVDPLPATTVPARRSAGVERAAWTFYVIAAIGSSIGQIWVGVDTPPWPATVPVWTRVLLVAPFAIVIDLGGAVASAFADSRRRLGEAAYGWRILSAASVTLAVGINVVGHAGSPYLATVFGGLGVFAYSVWLLHSAARRRDALRAAGMLRPTAPAYGLMQWKREPTVTWRARTLAIDHGYDRVHSLTLARTQLADEARRAALADHIEAKIRARHKDDPILASIAATTTPVDDVAQELIDLIDAHGWAVVINAQIQPPTPAAAPTAEPAPTPTHQPSPADDAESPHDTPDLDDDMEDDDLDDDEADLADETDDLTGNAADLAAIVPTKPKVYHRWRAMWIDISDRPKEKNRDLADDLATSVRTVQRIRAVGAAGLLDAPQPPTPRVLRLAATNGVPREYPS
jgi:hypothetical protein